MQTTTPDHNPYAPPASALESAERPAYGESHDPEDIAAAQKQLNEHTSDRAKLDEDRRLESGFLSPVGWVMLVLVLVGAGLGVLPALSGGDAGTGILIAALVVPIPFLALVVAVINSLLLGRRSAATDPQRALKQHLKAMQLGRFGTVAAGLSPSARQRPVSAPILGDYPVGSGSFVLSDKKQVKKFLGAFARTGSGQIRWMKVKKVVALQSDQPDVAVVRATVQWIAWPQWANYLSLVLFLLVQMVGLIVALVLYYSLRKVRRVDFERTLLRGRDGLWYLYLPDPVERQVAT